MPVLGNSAGYGHHEVIVILDMTSSMGWDGQDIREDGIFLAPDSLRQFVAVLPSFWHIGLVTFNSEVVSVVPPGEDSRLAIDDVLRSAYYSRSTNTGAALLQAVDLFSENALSRSIVFLTDGRVLHIPARYTWITLSEAEELLDTAITQIVDYEIPVHILMIGNRFGNDIHFVNPANNLPELTGGELLLAPNVNELNEHISDLMFGRFGVNSQSVGIGSFSPDVRGSFTIPLPDVSIGIARVLITSESPVVDISVSGIAENINIQQGRRFAAIEIVNPSDQIFNVEFATSGRVNAELVLEWLIYHEYNITYLDSRQHRTGVVDNSQVTIEYISRTAQVRFTLVDDEGENLLHHPYFNGQTLPLYVDGIQTQGQIVYGYILWETDLTHITENRFHNIRLYLDSFEMNIPNRFVEFVMELEAPPPPISISPDFDPRILIATILVLLLIIVSLLFALHSKPRKSGKKITPKPLPTPTVHEGNFEFTGKLNLYITNTPNDLDIRPQVFDLFRLGGKREVTLQTILDKCNITEGFSGSNGIRFIASSNGKIQVTHNSGCTVLVGQEILRVNQKHALSYGMKLHITFEDEVSEMELHYKSVKPSEKKASANPSIRYYESY